VSKTEIIAALATLNPNELAEVQAKLDELTGAMWLDEDFTSADKAALDEAPAEHEKNPQAGSSWEDVRARIAGNIIARS
jgi:hypothetical protein